MSAVSWQPHETESDTDGWLHDYPALEAAKIHREAFQCLIRAYVGPGDQCVGPLRHRDIDHRSESFLSGTVNKCKVFSIPGPARTCFGLKWDFVPL